jgi:hypothetical protein
MTMPIDLRQFAREYVVKPRNSVDAWLLSIGCDYDGEIFPHSNSLLAVSVNNRRLATRLAKLPFVSVYADGDDGMMLLFPPRHFSEIARLCGARRKKRRFTN